MKDNILKSFTKKKIGRFVLGCGFGIFVTGIFWVTAWFTYVDISVIQGFIGGSILTLSSGWMAASNNFDEFMKSFNFTL